MPLFNVDFPANAQFFYSFINTIATFNIIPVGDAINFMFNFNSDYATFDNFQQMDIFESEITILIYCP